MRAEQHDGRAWNYGERAGCCKGLQLIDALNTVAGDVASSLSAIKTAIAGVNEFFASTAAAVEEQSIVTSDMSSNMQRASAELA